MAKADFKNELEALGYSTQEHSNGMIGIEYVIPVGKNSGKSVEVAFDVPKDYPMNVPHGPHFKSQKIEGWIEPSRQIHNSPLGSEWRHWSRPFPDWNRTMRSVKSYMAHIRNVLANI